MDITTSFIDSNFTSGFVGYFLDLEFNEAVSDPENISQSGTYYISKVSDSSYVDVKPVLVTINNCSVTGINSMPSTNNFSVFPNPSTGQVKILVQKQESFNLEICNMIGSIVYEQRFSKFIGLKDIDLTSFHKGVYFVKITTGSKSYKHKIVIQ